MKLGIDIIEIERIQKAIERNNAFIERVYTPIEVSYCKSKGKHQYESFAGLYAAKEAFLKACGTGLSGAPFRPLVERLEGVDLSAGMVEQARRKNLYDRLETGDLTEAVDRYQRENARFDLILAADVFVYCADLTLIVSLVAQILADDGLFAFTVETHAQDGVILGPKLRYAHGEAHVRGALEAAGLCVLRLEAVSTRNEADVPVPGLLVIAGRA